MINETDINIRRSEVHEKINTLQDELNDLEAALRVVKNISESKKNKQSLVKINASAAVSAQKNCTKTSIPEMIYKILDENADGKSVTHLLKEIHKVYDPNIGRQNLATTLTRLKNKGVLVKSGNKLWALKKETSDANTSDVLESTGETVNLPKDSQEINTLAEPLVSTGNRPQKGGGNGS